MTIRELWVRYWDLMADPYVRAPMIVLTVIAVGCWVVMLLLLLTWH